MKYFFKEYSETIMLETVGNKICENICDTDKYYGSQANILEARLFESDNCHHYFRTITIINHYFSKSPKKHQRSNHWAAMRFWYYFFRRIANFYYLL